MAPPMMFSGIKEIKVQSKFSPHKIVFTVLPAEGWND
jgi:hypothetical protein